MRNPDAILQRRLAGVAFETAAPPRLDELPRMDVALFAGFAARGPVGLPVAVEDAQQFAAVFGDDAPLAWDAERGELARAQLAPAVRLFFANGGRRCWVLRLAREPRTSVLQVPGVVRIAADGGAAPLVLAASSPGRWADGVTLASSVTSARAAFLRWLPQGAELLLADGTGLAIGDLLCFRWPEAGCACYAGVRTLEAVGVPRGANRRQVQVRFDGALEQLEETRWPATFEGSARWQGGTAPARLQSDAFASPPASDAALVLALAVPAHQAPAPGTVLVVDLGDDQLLFCTGEALHDPGTAAGVLLQGRGLWRVPAVPPTGIPSVERLRLSLWARDGEGATLRLDELGLGRAHARHPHRLPEDQRVHRPDQVDTLQPWRDALLPRFPITGAMPWHEEDGQRREDAGLLLPFGVQTLPGAALAARHSGEPPLLRDGLQDFDARLFGEPELFASFASTLVADAEDLRMRAGAAARDPAGLHAALFVEEASLLAVPDAVQPGWLQEPGAALLAPDPSPVPPPDARDDDFIDCGSQPGPAPVLTGSTPGGQAVHLRWLADPAVSGPFQLEEARQRDWSDASIAWQGEGAVAVLEGRAAGDAFYRVRALGGAGTPWSNGIAVRMGAGDEAWRMRRGDEYDDATLRAVHRMLLRIALARSDALALLSLPRHYREDRALAHQDRIAAGVLDSASANGAVLPLGGTEGAAFDHAALYHGWLHGRDPDGVLRSSSPEGAMAGLLARRADERGAWVAPANEPLRGAVALDHAVAPERWLALLQAQVNVLRQDARGFLVLSADTLAADDDLRPINVRRLLALLRRAALRHGERWVFDPNDDSFRRGVERSFTALLGDLFRRGAFAGRTAPAAFQVVTDASLNTRQSVDAGRFIVELRVAPSRPMSFLTIRLTQTGDGVAASGR